MLSPGRRPSVNMGVQATHPRGLMTLSRRLVYPLCLLAGSLLAVVAGALHPDIAGQDGPSQLGVIAQSRAWPAIPWAFLFSFPLSLPGPVGARRRRGRGWRRDRAGVGLPGRHEGGSGRLRASSRLAARDRGGDAARGVTVATLQQ